MVRHLFHIFSASTIVLTLGIPIAIPVQAQIVPDRTLPSNSVTVPNCVICTINGGTTSGTNLFHSFDRFSIPTNGSAYFNNAPEIQTIFTRITGNQISNINGTIRNNGTASLFLMNPNGIVFGPNTSLNLGGSFVGTTANAIGFGSREVFSASNPSAPPLLTIDPSALVFNSGNTGRIDSRGILEVPTGKSLALVGGKINLVGSYLIAQGGRIELGGLAAPGKVGLAIAENIIKLSFPAGVLRSDVSLKADTSLLRKSILFSQYRSGGDILITANNLEMLDSFILAGITFGLTQIGSRAGDVTLDVDNRIMLNEATSVSNSVLKSPNGDVGTGDSGTISIRGRSLAVQGGSSILSFHAGTGKTSNILITTQDFVSVSGTSFKGRTSTIISQGLAGQGNTGTIQIQTGQFLLDGGTISTSTNRLGAGGLIIIKARESIEIKGLITRQTVSKSFPEQVVFGSIESDVQAGGIGKGGDIYLSTRSLIMTNGSKIRSATVGNGDSGSIIIEANDRVLLDGSAILPYGISATGLSTQTLSKKGGKGGEIQIKTGDLLLTRGADIDASTSGLGNTGDIFISAKNSIIVDGEASTLYVPKIGQPFSIRSGISAQIGPDAIGNGGIIQLKSRTLSLLNGGGIFTVVAGQGNAAAIDIVAQDSVLIKGITTDNEPSIILSGVNQQYSGHF